MENEEMKNNSGGFTVNVYSSGNNIAKEITQNIYGNVYNGHSAQDASYHYSDKQIATALANIVGTGKAIDSKQKWAGAQWLLRWECNFPPKPQDFCERVAKLPLPNDLEFPCDYNNIRALSTLSFMDQDPREIDKVKYSPSDKQAFFQLKTVVIDLKEELKKQRIRVAV